jgi:DNA-binding NtrC family response regulator
LRHRKKILIVDCDADYLISLERHLEEGGFDTTTTWDVCEAIALLGSRQFNVLLVGDHPPEVTCEEILKGFQSRGSVPCIVLQAATRHPFEAQYLSSLGAYAVVPKQKIKEVMDKVHQSLKNSHGASAGAA